MLDSQIVLESVVNSLLAQQLQFNVDFGELSNLEQVGELLTEHPSGSTMNWTAMAIADGDWIDVVKGVVKNMAQLTMKCLAFWRRSNDLKRCVVNQAVVALWRACTL